MRLTALDLGPPTESFRLAAELEAAGYHRHWLAEHQPQPQPLVVLPLLAGMTETIRVGTAGVLFHYYAPTRTAFDFEFLASCFPGRIDAGICAGMIGDAALADDQLDGRDRDAHLARYTDRVATFVQTLRGARPPVEEDDAPPPPEIWSLGSGPRSARLAARHGLHLGYSIFHQFSADDPDAVDRYRDEFVAPAPGARPYVAIAVGGVCAETDDDAAAIAARHTNPFFRLNVVGAPARCADQLAAIAARYHADEVVFAALCDGYEERVACYRLLASALVGAPATAEE